MWLKVIIIILLLGLVVSLGSGLVFLFKDVGTTKRTLHSLGVRITLAAMLMATVIYGFFSGQLEIGAPWDGRKFHGMPVEKTSHPSPIEKPSEPAATTSEKDTLPEQ